jgi:hypothetical protein
VPSCTWLEPEFLALPLPARLVALYVLSGPYTNGLGLYRLVPEAAAADLQISAAAFRRHFSAACHAFNWRFDGAARVVWIPDWLSVNAPQSINVVKSWRTAFNDVPPCPLKQDALTAIQAFLEAKGNGYRDAFGQVLPEDNAIRERDRESESETEHKDARAALARASDPAPLHMGASRKNGHGLREAFDAFWAVYPKKVGKADAWTAWKKRKPSADVSAQICAALSWQVKQDGWIREGGRYVPNPATWIRRGQWDDEPTTAPRLNERTIAVGRAAEEFLK